MEELDRKRRQVAAGASAYAEAIPRLLSTAEAAEYLRYRTTSGIRNAVARGELAPFGAGQRDRTCSRSTS